MKASGKLVTLNQNAEKHWTHLKMKLCFSWLFASMMVFASGCRSIDKLPSPSSKTYAAFVSSFYVGLAALQVGDDVRADSSLEQATKLVPGEPASWANWGILALRQRNFDAGASRFNRAKDLEPNNDRIFYLLGLLESDQGNSAQASAYLRQAIKLNPRNLRAIYQLASEVERQGDDHSAADFQQLIEQILAVEPNNLAALLDLSRVAAKRGGRYLVTLDGKQNCGQNRAHGLLKFSSSLLHSRQLRRVRIHERRRHARSFCVMC